MYFIDIDSLINRFQDIQLDFNSKKPFRYVVIENLFLYDKADMINSAFPSVTEGIWDGTTYINQKNKFQKSQFESGSIFNDVFAELNSPEFVQLLEQLSYIPDLIPDRKLFGAGLHQSINGANLNVHVDYNIHPITKFHRRLNVLIYMNKLWQPSYEGNLELWDYTLDKPKQMAVIAPLFNRCVIFETNEISFHGHPKPLNTPEGLSRKSLATYYYTHERPLNETAPEHNTIFVNTEGLLGQLRNFISGIKAAYERISKK